MLNFPSSSSPAAPLVSLLANSIVSRPQNRFPRVSSAPGGGEVEAVSECGMWLAESQKLAGLIELLIKAQNRRVERKKELCSLK